MRGKPFSLSKRGKILKGKEAFASLISSQKFSSDQIRFIDVIIMYLSANGMIELDRLFYPPFTDVDSQDIVGLFDNSTAQGILAAIESVNKGVESA